MMKTMVIEPVRAFNGMDVLVARDEGLFAAEGLDLQCAYLQPDGTWVADISVDGNAYAAFVRASTAAIQRINADKKRYLHYYTREYANYLEVAALISDDFHLGRMQLKAPEPLPDADARWDWEWMSSWGLLPGAFDAATQINAAVQHLAHCGS
jgi:ABC-type nitrate/sulfonate/bicarbonate transport system substrate-binding protein